MRKFYVASAHIFQTASGKLGSHPEEPIFQTLSGISESKQIRATASHESSSKSSPLALAGLARAFPLSWSHYVQLIGHSRSPEAFAFYQAEALRGGGLSASFVDRRIANSTSARFSRKIKRKCSKTGQLMSEHTITSATAFISIKVMGMLPGVSSLSNSRATSMILVFRRRIPTKHLFNSRSLVTCWLQAIAVDENCVRIRQVESS
jgi:hypothetical protein